MVRAVSGRGRGKYWSASVLKKRGWTGELIRKLLPEPKYIKTQGKNLRMWDKEVVRQAESDPRFTDKKNTPQRREGGHRPQSAGAKRAAQMLERAWDGAERDTSPRLDAGRILPQGNTLQAARRS